MNKGRQLNGITWYFPKDLAHIQAYDRARAIAKQFYDRDLPEWIDMTEAQRVEVRAHNTVHWKDMHDLRNLDRRPR